jgi:GNAT superfamily N-acetyltransferase
VLFKVRSAVQEDSPEVVRVIQAVYDEYGFTWDAEEYNADLYDLEGHFLARGHCFWVAEEVDGPVRGTAGLKFFDPVVGDGETTIVDGIIRVTGADCRLERLYVDPQARRVGMGVTLLEQVIATAKEAGRRRMEIWSDKKLTKAHALYQKYGAVLVGERLCDDPDNSPEWGMRLDLVK